MEIFFLKEIIDIMPEDDILVYSDAGSSFNFKAKEKFFSYIDLLNQSSSGI